MALLHYALPAEFNHGLSGVSARGLHDEYSMKVLDLDPFAFLLMWASFFCNVARTSNLYGHIWSPNYWRLRVFDGAGVLRIVD